MNRFSFGIALLLGVLACEHTEPFQVNAPPPIIGPLSTSFPLRLTYNAGADAYPSWVPDGSRLLYQAENPDRSDRDRCLFSLPATGGTAIPVICDGEPGSDDTTNAFGPSAVSPTGRIIFYQGANPAGLGTPTSAGMYVAPAVPPTNAGLALALPVVTPGGARADKLIALRWLGDSAFLALGVRTTLASRCRYCVLDTLETGVEVLRVSLGSDPAVVTAVPGTARASSYSFVPPDTVYFTVNGDTRIWRTRVAGGSVDSVFGFEPESTVAPPGDRVAYPAIARGVQVRGDIVYAVAGGRLDYYPDSGQGEAQRDWGGDVHKIHLSTGADTVLSYQPPLGSSNLEYVWMRNLALSPDGRVLAAEGRVTTLVNKFDPNPPYEQWLGTDTLIPPSGNLWQYLDP